MEQSYIANTAVIFVKIYNTTNIYTFGYVGPWLLYKLCVTLCKITMF